MMDENKKNMSSDEMDDVCEECKTAFESVRAKLVMHGYKICDSCKLSKTVFPI